MEEKKAVCVNAGLTSSYAWESFLVPCTCVFPTVFGRSQCKLIKYVVINVLNSLFTCFCLEGNSEIKNLDWGNGRHSLPTMGFEQSRKLAH